METMMFLYNLLFIKLINTSMNEMVAEKMTDMLYDIISPSSANYVDNNVEVEDEVVENTTYVEHDEELFSEVEA